MNRRLLLLLFGGLALLVPAWSSIFAAQQVTRSSAPSGVIGVSSFNPQGLQVELEGQVPFVPADGTPHRVANIVIAEADFDYDFAASAPVLSAPGTFGPPSRCGTGTKAYGVVSTWPGGDFHSNGPPLTNVGELTVTFPPDAIPGCLGFGAVVSVTFTVIGPDEED